jgi:hypothetical protein
MLPQAVTRADQVLRWTCPRSPGGDRRPLRSKRTAEPQVALVISFSGTSASPKPGGRALASVNDLGISAHGRERHRTFLRDALHCRGQCVGARTRRASGERMGIAASRSVPQEVASRRVSESADHSVQRRRHPCRRVLFRPRLLRKLPGSPRRVTRFTSTSSSTATRSGSRR